MLFEHTKIIANLLRMSTDRCIRLWNVKRCEKLWRWDKWQKRRPGRNSTARPTD